MDILEVGPLFHSPHTQMYIPEFWTHGSHLLHIYPFLLPLVTSTLMTSTNSSQERKLFGVILPPIDVPYPAMQSVTGRSAVPAPPGSSLGNALASLLPYLLNQNQVLQAKSPSDSSALAQKHSKLWKLEYYCKSNNAKQ